MRLPGEHPVATYREWAKIFIPALALFAAGVAAIIAFLQFNLARESAERQDRAYFFIKSASIALPVGEKPIATVEFANYGKTPAYEVRQFGRCRIVSFPAPFGEAIPPNFTSKSLLAPVGGDSISTGYTCEASLTQPQLQELNEGKIAVYVDGLIQYRDVFGKEHTTGFKKLVGGNIPPWDDRLGDSSESVIVN